MQIDKPLKQSINDPQTKQVGLSDFEIVSHLGKGAFGRVYKVIHKESNKVLAMKMLRKKYLIRDNQIFIDRKEHTVT